MSCSCRATTSCTTTTPRWCCRGWRVCPAAPWWPLIPRHEWWTYPKPTSRLILSASTWLLCNASEGAQLSARTDVVESATLLASMNDQLNVVVRNGANGCVVATNRLPAEVVEGFATNVLDTNGAGDVHNGVFLAELITGHDVRDAARWANAAAAISISRLGPATCPTREEVAAWIDSRR